MRSKVQQPMPETDLSPGIVAGSSLPWAALVHFTRLALTTTEYFSRLKYWSCLVKKCVVVLKCDCANKAYVQCTLCIVHDIVWWSVSALVCEDWHYDAYCASALALTVYCAKLKSHCVVCPRSYMDWLHSILSQTQVSL